jgi:chromosome segregation ATPase
MPNEPAANKAALIATAASDVAALSDKETKPAPNISGSSVPDAKADPTPDATADTSTPDVPVDSSSATSIHLPAPNENEGPLREKLEQQQKDFDRQLEEQRRDMQDKMQQLQQKFSQQLQRLEDHHRQETETSNFQHEAALAHWQQQVKDQEILLESQTKSAESDEQKSQEAIDKLTSQLNQARELLADKEKEDRKLQEAHLQQLRAMEKQVFKKDDASNNLEQEIKNLQKKLEESKKETETALGDYGKLKERAKTVAGELKEKRAECRTLSSEIDLLKGTQASLQDRITQLEAKGLDMNQSSEETQAKLDSLQSSLDETKKELEETNKDLEQEKKKAEESLSNYKRKAQQSLSLANARSASAVQAREEAEMEARAARATADTAMERAMKSELNGKQALAEAKVYVEQMKGEVEKYESVKTQLEDTTKKLKQVHSEAETNKDSNEKLRCELTSLAGRLEAEQTTVEDLKGKLSVAQIRSNEMYDEVERLRRESQRHQDEIKRLSEANKTAASSSTSEEEMAAIVRSANAEADATIAMLQQELQDSNQAIKGLKESLKAAMEEKDLSGGYSNGNGTTNGNHHQSESNNMPLFYAMEKQAELTQARDEIARLATLLGDAESTKQEALDEMFDMKRNMEDAQSKLQRQEQLQKKNEGEDKSLNLEYLKNIVLSYLNAETIAEKKALLPVIGTVLCLTQEEQMKAIQQLDKGNGSVIDSVTTSVLGLF